MFDMSVLSVICWHLLLDFYTLEKDMMSYANFIFNHHHRHHFCVCTTNFSSATAFNVTLNAGNSISLRSCQYTSLFSGCPA